MTSVAAAVAGVARRLAASGVEGGRLDARLLVGAALGWPIERLVAHGDEAMPEAAAARLEALARRRIAREPLAQIMGEREFWGLPFRVTADVLTPRPDTETVVEAALEAIGARDRALRVLDLGAGSGCLLAALLSEWPHATGLGIEASPAAQAVARDNLARLGLAGRGEIRAGDWTAGLVGSFDVAVSNPPYIPTAEIGLLQPEVAQFEPRLALDGGPDGLDAYRLLARTLPAVLVPGAAVVLEVGAGQAHDVCNLLERQGFSAVSMRRDLAGIERAVIARGP